MIREYFIEGVTIAVNLIGRDCGKVLLECFEDDLTRIAAVFQANARNLFWDAGRAGASCVRRKKKPPIYRHPG